MRGRRRRSGQSDDRKCRLHRRRLRGLGLRTRKRRAEVQAARIIHPSSPFALSWEFATSQTAGRGSFFLSSAPIASGKRHIAGTVSTFFQQRNNGTGHENVVPTLHTTGTVLQYNDLQKQERFVSSVDAPPVFKKSGHSTGFFFALASRRRSQANPTWHGEVRSTKTAGEDCHSVICASG